MLAHSVDHPYLGQRLALLTQHSKEAILAPVLDTALGCRVTRVEGFDTDTLGTFTRDIARPGSQIEAARRKARIGMEISGLPLGLASEGSFGADPFLGALPWNTELLLFIDAARGIEVHSQTQQATRYAHTLTGDWQAARLFAEAAGFPEHNLVLRPAHQDDARIEKGIADWSTLAAAFGCAREAADNGLVFLEHDTRAHAHPTRREAIHLAAENLRDKLLSLCPACGTPGFWLSERLPGLLCADCGAPTRETRAEVWGCPKCGLRETRVIPAQSLADPGRCDFCNP